MESLSSRKRPSMTIGRNTQHTKPNFQLKARPRATAITMPKQGVFALKKS
jgi:hypothetical protein